jgi:hypothetical protein
MEAEEGTEQEQEQEHEHEEARVCRSGSALLSLCPPRLQQADAVNTAPSLSAPSGTAQAPRPADQAL